MLRRWPHVCHVKIIFTILLTNWLASTTTNSMKCLVNCIPLRICFRFRNAQLCVIIHFPLGDCLAMNSEIRRESVFVAPTAVEAASYQKFEFVLGKKIWRFMDSAGIKNSYPNGTIHFTLLLPKNLLVQFDCLFDFSLSSPCKDSQ